ncbi:MAG: hypothetical protein ACOC8N_04505 [Spirochaetota bacterium]
MSPGAGNLRWAAHMAVITAVLLLASCATRQVRETAGREAELVQAVYLYNQSVHTLEGEGVGVYRSPEDKLSFRARITAYWPEMNLRLEVRDLVFRKPLITLVRRDELVYAAVHPRRQYLEVAYDEADLGALAGFDLPRDLVIHTLMGKVYVERASGQGENAGGRIAGAGGDTLVIGGTNLETRVIFDREMVPRAVEYRVAGDTLTVTFGKHLEEQGVAFPRRIHLRGGEGSTTLEITYSAVRLNGDPRRVSLQPDEWEGYERVR